MKTLPASEEEHLIDFCPETVLRFDDHDISITEVYKVSESLDVVCVTSTLSEKEYSWKFLQKLGLLSTFDYNSEFVTVNI